MPKWDPESLSKGFLYAAESADAYLREIGPKTHNQPTYKNMYDIHLADFYVHNRLHGRTWLQSRELLLSELHAMRANVPPGAGAFDQKEFARAYLALVDKFIDDFSENET